MHIGNKIREVLKEKGCTIVWFAKELSCHRTNIYKIFEKPSLDTNDLFRVSRILNHDFFKDLSMEYQNIMKRSSPPL